MAEVRSEVLDELERLGVPYEVIPCEPEYADTEAFCERYGYPLERSANTILVASKRPKGRHCACVLLAPTKLDVNRTVCRLLGVSKASFTSAEEVRRLTGQELGGVTVLGLPEDLPVFVDARVMEPDRVILGAGSRSAKIEVSQEIFRKMGRAEVVEGLAG